MMKSHLSLCLVSVVGEQDKGVPHVVPLPPALVHHAQSWGSILCTTAYHKHLCGTYCPGDGGGEGDFGVRCYHIQ